MFIFRIEAKDGCGPYTSKHFTYDDWGGGYHNSSKMHPTLDDEGIRVGAKHRCGFLSMKALTEWFNSREREALYYLHCEIVVYKVHPSHVIVGSRQVSFDVTKAKRIQDHD